MDTEAAMRDCGRDVSCSHQDGRVGPVEKAVVQTEAQRPKNSKATVSLISC